jgi:hypothetical protein
VTFLLLLLLAACGSEQKACDPSQLTGPTTDCASVSSQTDWTLGPTGGPVGLFVGQSKRVFVNEVALNDCRDSVSEVIWRVEDGQVASVLPESRPRLDEAWVTGRVPGSTRVVARIRFADGKERDTTPIEVRVTPPDPPTPGSRLIAEGEIEIAAGEGPKTLNHYVAFQVAERGILDMSLDWDSPLLTANFVLWSGTCTAGVCPGAFIPLQEMSGVKPIQKASSILEPGEYTLRLDYSLEPATVLRYGVRLVPQ